MDAAALLRAKRAELAKVQELRRSSAALVQYVEKAAADFKTLGGGVACAWRLGAAPRG